MDSDQKYLILTAIDNTFNWEQLENNEEYLVVVESPANESPDLEKGVLYLKYKGGKTFKDFHDNTWEEYEVTGIWLPFSVHKV
ncbi:MAG: hypothetical protein AABY22_14220 [Nanoarchaeota archaeon]